MHKVNSLLLPILLLCSCNEQKEETIHNYHEIKNSLIEWKTIFDQDEDDYLVYFYSELCGHCTSIKQDIIYFYLNNVYTMYFVCSDYEKIIGPAKDLIGIGSIDDFYIFGTPFMIEIKEHSVSGYYAGANEILESISILNKK